MPPFSSCDVTGEPRFGFANSEAGRKRQVRKGAINNFASHLSIRCKGTRYEAREGCPCTQTRCRSSPHVGGCDGLSLERRPYGGIRRAK